VLGSYWRDTCPKRPSLFSLSLQAGSMSHYGPLRLVPAHVQTAAQRDTHGQQALGLTPTIVHDPVPEQVHRICENARQIQDQIDNLRATPEPGEGDDAINLGLAWPEPSIRYRAPVLQPPKPEISPATAILARVQQRQASVAEHS
jgi:hypothetical protein